MTFDKQAARKLREFLEGSEWKGFDEKNGNKLLAIVREMLPAALDRIDELEAALVDQTAMIIFHQRMMPVCGMQNWATLPNEDSSIRLCGRSLPLPGKLHWRQLAREMPQFDWEDVE